MYQTETDERASRRISLTGVLVVFLSDVLFYLKDASNCSKIAIASAYQVCNYCDSCFIQKMAFCFKSSPIRLEKTLKRARKYLSSTWDHTVILFFLGDVLLNASRCMDFSWSEYCSTSFRKIEKKIEYFCAKFTTATCFPSVTSFHSLC